MLQPPVETLVDPARRPAAGAIVQDEYDVDSHWHTHDMHQLQYAFEGSIEVADDELGEWDMLRIPPSGKHGAAHFPQGATLLVVTLR